jgi:hypothetical protein
MKVLKYLCLLVAIPLFVFASIIGARPQEPPPEVKARLNEKIQRTYSDLKGMIIAGRVTFDMAKDVRPTAENIVNYFPANNIFLILWDSQGKMLRTKGEIMSFWMSAFRSRVSEVTFRQQKEPIFIRVEQEIPNIASDSEQCIDYIAYVTGQFSFAASPNQNVGSYMMIMRHPLLCEW